jgi:arylsulfatase A-like enzyme
MTELIHPRTRPAATATRPEGQGESRRDGNLPKPRASGLLVLAVWLALATGLLEMLLLYARKELIDSTAVSSLQLNQHARWMIPLSHGMIFGAGGVVAAAAVFFTRARWVMAAGVLGLCFLSAYALLLTYRGLSTIAYLVFSGGVACQIAPLVLSQLRRPSRLVVYSFPALIGLVAILFGVHSWQEKLDLGRLATPVPGAPNVLFIVLDTVRAESLSLHGYGRETSPNLVRISQSGVRFEQARSTASWTLPSHASMFTGRWPHELSTRIDRPLDATYPTLAEFLRDHGYATAGFVGNTYFCSVWYGLSRGFIHYEDVAVIPVEILRSSTLGRYLVKKLAPANRNRKDAYFDRKDAATINQEVLDWLAGGHDGRPFFAFLNYYDAHDPYLTPRWASQHFGLRPTSRAELAKLRDWLRVDGAKVSSHTRELARDCYDDCLAYLDHQLGRLFDELKTRGLLENTLIVITSDHGEEFGEYGRFGHGQSLHRQVINVPLLIVEPGKAAGGGRVSTAVSLRDLPATVVDLLGLASESPFPGHSLARHWSGAATAPEEADEPILSETADEVSHITIGPKTARSLVENGKLYIRNKDGREELYDIIADPAESRDLSAATDLQQALTGFREKMARIDARAVMLQRRATVDGRRGRSAISATVTSTVDLCD